jgi:hypothetical protein
MLVLLSRVQTYIEVTVGLCEQIYFVVRGADSNLRNPEFQESSKELNLLVAIRKRFLFDLCLSIYYKLEQFFAVLLIAEELVVCFSNLTHESRFDFLDLGALLVVSEVHSTTDLKPSDQTLTDLLEFVLVEPAHSHELFTSEVV